VRQVLGNNKCSLEAKALSLDIKLYKGLLLKRNLAQGLDAILSGSSESIFINPSSQVQECCSARHAGLTRPYCWSSPP
jgi:hypothetical protein